MMTYTAGLFHPSPGDTCVPLLPGSELRVGDGFVCLGPYGPLPGALNTICTQYIR